MKMQMKEMLTAKFKIKYSGKLKHLDQSDSCVKMSQKRCVEKVLERFNMQDCKPRATPCEQKLSYTAEAVMMMSESTERQ